MSVYRIYDINEPKQFYIGSCKDFNHRKASHKIDYKRTNNKLYEYIKNNGEWDCFNMEVLEYCLNYKEREKELIKTLNPPLNTVLYNFNQKEWSKKYREENKDKIKEWFKKYREENKDKMKETDKKYREENKDKIKKEQKIYREENKDKISEYKKIYREENKDKIKKEQKIYREKNKDKMKDYSKKLYVYQKSWGGDERRNNNLLKIDIKIFD